MASVQKVQVFAEECWSELQKVTWPDSDQLRSATLVVILFTVAVSAVIWLMDVVSDWGIRTIMGIFGA